MLYHSYTAVTHEMWLYIYGSLFYHSYTAVTHEMWLYIYGSLFWKISSPRYIIVIQL
jgi:cation transport regulator ChaC